MDGGPPNPLFQTAEELAGVHHEEMVRSEKSTLAFLSAPDLRLRLAAILICETTWSCASDSRVVEACCDIAKSDADDAARIFAILSMSAALSGTKAPDASVFLASIVADCDDSAQVRLEAYWALREIQHGVKDVELDAFIKRTICMAKSIMRAVPFCSSEDDFRRNLTPQPGFPEEFWDSAEDIDWDFVELFTRPS